MTANPVGGGSTEGGERRLSGSSFTVVAIPNPGYAFVNWKENGILVSSSANYTFTANRDRTLTAYFEPSTGPSFTYAFEELFGFSFPPSRPNDLIEASDGNFYGTSFTVPPSSLDYSTVFKVTKEGKLTTLVTFGGGKGWEPRGGVIEGRDGNFYGTTRFGGAGYWGTVFRMTPQGNLTTLASFSGPNGGSPVGGLLLCDDGFFYGTTEGGGANNLGTVFKMRPDGMLTTLVSFDGTNGIS